jgi:predicted ATPase
MTSPKQQSAKEPQPYAQFWRCDLQCHSPLEPEFKPGVSRDDKAAVTGAAKRYVDAAVERGLDAIAVTDHNSVAFLKELVAAATGRLVIFPGIEVSAADGYHLLVIFEIGTRPAVIQEFLAKIGIKAGEERGPQGEPVCAEDGWSWGKILDEVARRSDAIAIAPHVRSGKGILKSSIAGEVKARNWKHPHLYAIEDNRKSLIPKGSMTDKVMLNELDDYRRVRVPARVWGSDCKSYDGLGSECTFIKMTEPSIEGLRQAFLDPGSRIRHPEDFQLHARDRILRVSWQAGFLSEQEVVFSEQLSCLIGGKGTGKSTVIESVRFALGKEHVDQPLASQYEGLLESALPRGTKVTLEVARRDGSRYTVSRTEPYEAEVSDETGVAVDIPAIDTIDPTILSQGEILSIARRPTSHLALLDAFLEDELSALQDTQEKIGRDLARNRSQFVEAIEERESLAEDRSEIIRLKEAKKAYDKRGLSARTEQRRALDREERLVKEAIEAASEAEAELAGLEEEVELPDLLVDRDLPHHELWKPLHKRWLKAAKVVADLRTKGAILYEGLAEELRQITASESEWVKSIARQREEVSAVYRELQEEYPDLDLAQFDRLDRALEELQSRIDDGAGIEAQISKLSGKRRKLLRRLRENRRDQFLLRNELAAGLNEALVGSVRIDVEFLGDRDSTLEHLLELKSGVRREALKRIVEHDDFTPERLGETLGKGAEATAATFDITEGQASTLISKTSIAHRLQLEELLIPERVVINFNTSRRGDDPRYRNLLNVSVGQKATCVLLILLAQDGPPLIVDQPEDDLDNRFVYDDIVKRLRDVKDKRQLILSTHNANIPVLGDAELIAVMDTEERSGRTAGVVSDLGSIDSASIRRSVTHILEGGRRAFRRRQEKYGAPGLDEDEQVGKT